MPDLQDDELIYKELCMFLYLQHNLHGYTHFDPVCTSTASRQHVFRDNMAILSNICNSTPTVPPTPAGVVNTGSLSSRQLFGYRKKPEPPRRTSKRIEEKTQQRKWQTTSPVYYILCAKVIADFYFTNLNYWQIEHTRGVAGMWTANKNLNIRSINTQHKTHNAPMARDCYDSVWVVIL